MFTFLIYSYLNWYYLMYFNVTLREFNFISFFSFKHNDLERLFVSLFVSEVYECCYVLH